MGLLFEEGSPEILESTFYEDERGPLHLSMDPTRFSTPKNYEEVQHEIRLVLGVDQTALRRGGLNLHKEFRRLEESGWHAFAHLRSTALLSDIEQPHSTLHIFEWVRYDLYPHAMHRGIRLIPSWKGICKPEARKFLRDEVFSGVQEREVTAAPFQPLRLLPKGEIPDFSGALEEFAVDFDIKVVRPQKPMLFFLTPGVEIVRYLGKESSIDIPARIAGEPVRISDFAAPSTLREVRIAEGVEVFDFAFWKCENLYDENGFQILGDRLLGYRGAGRNRPRAGRCAGDWLQCLFQQRGKDQRAAPRRPPRGRAEDGTICFRELRDAAQHLPARVPGMDRLARLSQLRKPRRSEPPARNTNRRQSFRGMQQAPGCRWLCGAQRLARPL